MNSFSKALSPALKVSFMVVPQHLADVLRKHYRSIGQTSSGLMQAVLYHLINEGKWHRHLNRARKGYERRYHLLISELQRGFPKNAKVISSDAGFHMLFQIPGINESELAKRALIQGVRIYPTSHFWHKPEEAPGDTILLGFGGLSEKQIITGVEIVRSIIKEMNG